MSLAIMESNVAGDHRTGFDPESSRTPGRKAGQTRIGPGVGRKPRPTSSALMRNSMEWARGAGVCVKDSGKPSATRSCSHQIDARGFLGHGVLDLQAGIDLEEGDAAIAAEQELHGSGADIACLRTDRFAAL
jgi:hypothetical protein